MIAGHTFPEHGPCECGIRWTTIRNATIQDLDKTGIAHTGKLNMHEVLQIQTRRLAEDARIAEAMEGLRK